MKACLRAGSPLPQATAACRSGAWSETGKRGASGASGSSTSMINGFTFACTSASRTAGMNSRSSCAMCRAVPRWASSLAG